MGTVTVDLSGAVRAAILSSRTTGRKGLGSSLARRAMRVLDCDRALLLAQPERGGGYRSRLARLTPLSCSPKHNVLLGWPMIGTATLSSERIESAETKQVEQLDYVVGPDRATSAAVVRDRFR